MVQTTINLRHKCRRTSGQQRKGALQQAMNVVLRAKFSLCLSLWSKRLAGIVFWLLFDADDLRLTQRRDHFDWTRQRSRPSIVFGRKTLRFSDSVERRLVFNWHAAAAQRSLQQNDDSKARSILCRARRISASAAQRRWHFMRAAETDKRATEDVVVVVFERERCWLAAYVARRRPISVQHDTVRPSQWRRTEQVLSLIVCSSCHHAGDGRRAELCGARRRLVAQTCPLTPALSYDIELTAASPPLSPNQT